MERLRQYLVSKSCVDLRVVDFSYTSSFGWGVYAKKRLKPGTRLMRIPVEVWYPTSAECSWNWLSKNYPETAGDLLRMSNPASRETTRFGALDDVISASVGSLTLLLALEMQSQIDNVTNHSSQDLSREEKPLLEATEDDVPLRPVPEYIELLLENQGCRQLPLFQTKASISIASVVRRLDKAQRQSFLIGIEDQRKHIADLYALLVSANSERAEKEGGARTSSLKRIGKAIFARAYALVLSRSVSLLKSRQPYFGMIPGVDVFNHQPQQCSMNLGMLHFSTVAQTFDVYALNELPEDEQIFLQYGTSMTELELFKLYGISAN